MPDGNDYCRLLVVRQQGVKVRLSTSHDCWRQLKSTFIPSLSPNSMVADQHRYIKDIDTGVYDGFQPPLFCAAVI